MTAREYPWGKTRGYPSLGPFSRGRIQRIPRSYFSPDELRRSDVR